ncbi:uncharacterized protein DDB_G0283357 [Uranotaenia lowii]|uniref:uncharacterized protein DDB_G0283357 n=1 Tax=Uranotaenia lowii TaxID=190385 RepID=UPI00247A74B6|nr:uncharacterized protein DDB_G0283357 [Uranotaenia lowii]
MVKILSSGSSDILSPEQYNDCSNFMLNPDDPPLEELDPAILSCGLPAIILSEIKPVQEAPVRYTASQLLAFRNSKLCFQRPAALDDPKIGNYRIWRESNQIVGSNGVVRNNNSAGTSTSTNREDTRIERGYNRNNVNLSNSNRQDRKQFQDRPKNFTSHENNFLGPRFRRNYEFSNRQQHVIVKSYRGGSDNNNHFQQDTAIEEEPEWVTAGPTSRLDTIELRGFDDDVSLPGLSSSQSSMEKAAGILVDGKAGYRNNSSEKHISFYDDLHHYEHMHNKRGSAGSSSGGSKFNDSSSGRDHDVESVATSNSSSPPPARSTPTKPSEYGAGSGADNTADVNVNNFEQFMKFDSFLGPENGSNNTHVGQTGTRFVKSFRRAYNSAPNQTVQGNYNQGYGDRRQSYYSGYNNNHNNYEFGGGQNYRYQYDRNQQQPHQQQQQRFQSGGSFGHQPSSVDSNAAFNRLVNMMAQNRANNNILAQQEYIMQLLNKNQQSEILRRILMQNTVQNVTDSNTNSHQQQQPKQQEQQQQEQPTSQEQSQQPRIPSRRELQFHTDSIMHNALLRKRLQDQRKMLVEQTNQIAAVAAVAAAANSVAAAEAANPIVQQFVKSVSPNMQRSLSVLCQTANQINNNPFIAANRARDEILSAAANQMNTNSFINTNREMGETVSKGSHNPSMFPGGQTEPELSAALQKILHQDPQNRFDANRKRFFKRRSVTWNSSVN